MSCNCDPRIMKEIRAAREALREALATANHRWSEWGDRAIETEKYIRRALLDIESVVK